MQMRTPPTQLATRYCSSGEAIVFNDTTIRDIRSKLTTWYAVERRMLPWRGDNTNFPVTAYGVWISEVMLQQTRVETVIDYWTRWMTEFPDVSTLAGATPEDVNRLWAGLGYYRRAQFLLQGAKKVVTEYNGVLPQTVAELLKIPGIGPYTAGAISSIAYGRPEALVDGNVMRVFSRLLALKLEVGGGAMEKHCWKVAKDLVPPDSPGDFNQALMELGATVCKPTSPNCAACPLRNECHALALTTLAKQIDSPTATSVVSTKKGQLELFVKGKETVSVPDIEDVNAYGFDTTLLPRDVAEFPRKVAKKKPKELVFSVCVLRTRHLFDCNGAGSSEGDSVDDYKYLFVRRPNTGLLANQWEFPSILVPSEGDCAEEPAEEIAAGSESNPLPSVDAAQLWKPFPEYLRGQLGYAYDGNQQAPAAQQARPGENQKIEPKLKAEEENLVATLLETASRTSFEPILHIFSHQRHTMHITLKDVVVLKSPGADADKGAAGQDGAIDSAVPPSVAFKWMTAREIVAAGITTGCKKVLHEVSKAEAKPVKKAGTKAAGKAGRSTNNKDDTGSGGKRSAGSAEPTTEEGAEQTTPSVMSVAKKEGMNAFELLKLASKATAVSTGKKKARK